MSYSALDKEVHDLFVVGEPQVVWMLAIGKRKPATYDQLKDAGMTGQFIFRRAEALGYMLVKTNAYELTDKAWAILDALNKEEVK